MESVTGIFIALIIVVIVTIGFFLIVMNLNNGVNDINDIESTTYNIEINNFEYSPQTLRINVGDTVVWANRDSEAHTVTSDDGELSSPLFGQGETYSHTFDTTGTFEYSCIPHPWMSGTVIVE